MRVPGWKPTKSRDFTHFVLGDDFETSLEEVEALVLSDGFNLDAPVFKML